MTGGFEPPLEVLQTCALPLGYVTINIKLIRVSKNDSDENRTRVTAVKGRCLDRLTTEPSAWRSFFDRLTMGFTRVLSEVTHELRTPLEPSVRRPTIALPTLLSSKIPR